jgi:hypothetical protein
VKIGHIPEGLCQTTVPFQELPFVPHRNTWQYRTSQRQNQEQRRKNRGSKEKKFHCVGGVEKHHLFGLSEFR